MRVNIWLFLLTSFIFTGCEEDVYIPKPIGYARMDFPTHDYQSLDVNAPFNFERGALATYVPVKGKQGHEGWFNLEYPEQKAKIHFSYLPVTGNNIEKYVEDARRLAMEHLSKADDYEENVVIDTAAKVYGVIYDFQGSTASNMQFYLTDSTSHFVRGALYFEVTPKADSIAPAEKYIEEEIQHLIRTFTWTQ